MRASTVFLAVTLAAIALFVPGLVIFHVRLVPNWPFVGLICMGASVAFGGAAVALTWRHLRKPSRVTARWLLLIFPVCLSAFAFFWSYVRATTEDYPSLDFSNGVVIEKYRSPNHQYLSVRVQVEGRGTLDVEGISLASWEKVRTGSRVAKRCGSTDITFESP
jgi:hypothetical protein